MVTLRDRENREATENTKKSMTLRNEILQREEREGGREEKEYTHFFRHISHPLQIQ